MLRDHGGVGILLEEGEQIVLVEVLFGFAVLALLPAPALFPRLDLVFVLILVDDEASTFLCVS